MWLRANKYHKPKNIWQQSYDAETQTIKTDYQMGIMPGVCLDYIFKIGSSISLCDQVHSIAN